MIAKTVQHREKKKQKKIQTKVNNIGTGMGSRTMMPKKKKLSKLFFLLFPFQRKKKKKSCTGGSGYGVVLRGGEG